MVSEFANIDFSSFTHYQVTVYFSDCQTLQIKHRLPLTSLPHLYFLLTRSVRGPKRLRFECPLTLIIFVLILKSIITL